MKIKILLVAMVAFGITSCTQYTCPTYSKEDSKEVEKEIVLDKNV